MADVFEGFANAVDPKGKQFDAREVDAYVDESDEGKIRDASINTPSSITQFKTEGTATNGAPMAVVPAPSEPEVEADADADEADADADDAAGGKEGAES